jgi:hypothetical protein
LRSLSRTENFSVL